MLDSDFRRRALLGSLFNSRIREKKNQVLALDLDQDRYLDLWYRIDQDLDICDHDLGSELQKKIMIARDDLHRYEPDQGYYLAFSGGKDSVVIHDLATRAGVKFDAHFNVMTVDPPEVLEFIERYYPGVEWHYPKLSMFELIEKKGYFPTGRARFCCPLLKADSGTGRIVVTGIRAAESHRRAKRDYIEADTRLKNKVYFNPIFHWSDEEVWDYIGLYELPLPSLYEDGFRRVGCIGCPMLGKLERLDQFRRYPEIKKGYIAAMQRALDRGIERPFKTGEEYFDWWNSRLSIAKFKELLGTGGGA